ncbi:MAG: glycosyltransferase family 2 protein [Desulfobacterales bacterium]|nr:glycosyltransferase family 2 protein [Desulfobacterales bacterium]
MIELKMKFNSVKEISQFFFDYGNGFNEEDSIFIPFKNGVLSKRLTFFATFPKAIRFNPVESKGDLHIQTLRFVKVTNNFAKDRVFRKINNFGYSNDKKLINDKMLLSAYNNIFDPKYMEKKDYKNWILQNEFKKYSNRNEISEQINQFYYKPLISIIVPVYNTDETYLRLCIESVLNQSYKNWELCIADDASSQKHVIKILKEYAQKEIRIKYTVRRTNGHISEASNSALALAQGEFVALLDHDDELFPHALFEVVKELNQYPEADIIYSDEDKIDEKGNRFNPHFKSDWNPALLYSQNYVSHLGVYRTEIIEKIGGFRKGFEGSQDYDLLLRSVAETSAEKIRHIPWVLYHWRAIEGSTALASEEKDYTTKAGIKALKDYFSKQDKKTTVVSGLLPNTYKVNYEIINQPLVTLLIPTRDRYDILSQCVDSIINKTTYKNYEIIVLDNQSSDPKTLDYFDKLKNTSNIRILRYDKPFNFSAINNYGVQHAAGSIIGLFNNDIEVISPHWLDEMVSLAIQDENGCVGAKLYYSNDTLQHAGVLLGVGGVGGHSHKHFKRSDPGYFGRLTVRQNFSAVTAACLLVRKEIYNMVNGLDQKLAIAFNDVDFCLRVREAGYKNIWTPYAELYHHESVSRGNEDTPEKQLRFQGEVNYMKKHWGCLLEKDPYYNPHLTNSREDFSIK